VALSGSLSGAAGRGGPRDRGAARAHRPGTRRSAWPVPGTGASAAARPGGASQMAPRA